MRELSLFSGGGGGLLASHLLGWTPIGYVEYNDYAQQIIAARIRDGYLPNAPIFGDIRAFLSEGYAASYHGLADVISGGFPCQPFSVAGKQLGADDPRNMWPQTIDVVRTVKPRFVFLENVPALISSGYIVTVIHDLQSAGYQVLPPLRLSASDVGAPHRRQRVWIVAHAENKGTFGGKWKQRDGDSQNGDGGYFTDRSGRHDGSEDVSHAHSHNRGTNSPEPDTRPNRGDIPGRIREDVADPYSIGWEGWTGAQRAEWWIEFAHSRENMANAKRRRRHQLAEESQDRRQTTQSERGSLGRLEERERQNGEWAHPPTPGAGWWTVEPDLGRVAHGVAHRVDRLKALGNGQVPAVAATAWRLLTHAD